MTIRILLVDDHPAVIEGLERALSREADFVVVALATTVAAARTALSSQPVDVALVDIRLPDGSGLELAAEYAARDVVPAWIILSSYETPQYVAAALSMGASAYLLKTSPTASVVGAVRRAAEGVIAFTADQVHEARLSGAIRLTPTDRTIIKGLLDGRSNDEIAAGLDISHKTVEAHLSRLYAAHDVSNRTELALKAEREDWLRLPREP